MLWEIFMAGVDLVLAPIQHILSDIKNSAEEKSKDEFYNASVISTLLEPIQEEVEGNEETLQIKAEGDQIDRDSWVVAAVASFHNEAFAFSLQNESSFHLIVSCLISAVKEEYDDNGKIAVVLILISPLFCQR
ncbi:hypothetical protein Ocin01_12099 [Orchesella cincta]|uniref:Uncharacterized protein n=1 Tax=Orchesella cincta TaxID=48709 RepID=A0A1D2MNW6_ORCCI|nr:hypothetical protein Ocin01_12099 [Orchesella cincta]